MESPAMAAADRDPLDTLAGVLWRAEATRVGCPPLREQAVVLGVATDADQAYAIQRINRDRRRRGGDRIVGRKIGLTARAVQRQLGVDTPDYGDLWASSAWGDGESLPIARFIAPKIEAEVALVMERDLDAPDATVADVLRAVAFALPAIEIVDSRIADWKIALFDTIADNASSAGFVLGGDPVLLTDVGLRSAGMRLERNGDSVSQGVGSACLGHPLNAAAWLARTLARRGEPLRCGDVLMTGALGPMVPAVAGDCFEASIEGLGSVALEFTA